MLHEIVYHLLVIVGYRMVVEVKRIVSFSISMFRHRCGNETFTRGHAKFHQENVSSGDSGSHLAHGPWEAGLIGSESFKGAHLVLIS